MKLSTKLFIGFVLVAFMFTVAGIVNFQLSEDVIENSKWVTRSQSVIRNSSSLQRNIIDMETGLRGYLLTGDQEFLQPYHTAARQLPGLFSDLMTLVRDSPEQIRKVKEIEELHKKWVKEYAELLIEEKRKEASKAIVMGIGGLERGYMVLNKEGKRLTDRIRIHFRAFNAMEYQVRDARNKRLKESIDETRNVSIALNIVSVVIGLTFIYYITRLISRRIMKMVNMADRIAHGEYKTQMQDDAHDELTRLSDSLNHMAATIDTTFTQLDSKNKELDQVAYVVSHDLKAPLRGIENASRWVEEDMGKELPAHIQEYLMMMRIRVHRMESLIDGILALARIGRTQIEEEVVNVQYLLFDIIDMLNPPAGFKIHIPDNLPTLRTTKIELQQIFTNLISNAIKYHHQQEGNITISYQSLEKDHEFSVSDDGPGIEPEYHERIFVLFQTLQERDAVESTGVGLAIVKKILERQGGRIWVTSTLGQGATFTFTLPKEKLKFS